MASDWIKTVQGDVIYAPNIKKLRASGQKLIIEHTAGADTQYEYPTASEAIAALGDIAAVVGAETVGDPVITSISPESANDSGFPTVISLVGQSFDASIQIVLQNYVSTYTPATTFISATAATFALTAEVVGAYDVLYTDSNGKAFRVPNGLVIY